MVDEIPWGSRREPIWKGMEVVQLLHVWGEQE